MYEMNLELKPFGSSFYKDFSQEKNLPWYQLSVYKKKTGKDSLIFRHFIDFIQRKKVNGELLRINNHQIDIADISLKEDWLDYRISIATDSSGL